MTSKRRSYSNRISRQVHQAPVLLYHVLLRLSYLLALVFDLASLDISIVYYHWPQKRLTARAAALQVFAAALSLLNHESRHFVGCGHMDDMKSKTGVFPELL